MGQGQLRRNSQLPSSTHTNRPAPPPQQPPNKVDSSRPQQAVLRTARSARLVPNIHIFYSRIFHRRPEIPPPGRSGHLPPTGCNTSGTLVPYSSPYVGASISGLWAAVLRCFVWTGPRTSSSGAFQDSCARRCRSIFKLNLVPARISVSL